ncbi:MAG: hypothetical protein ACUVTP_02880 [Candidatus Fervidibacter sp.]|uniref:hypothetical protein n=1 Tax=Candidatus Fervidibacter sp. TaxID=3100871 RepID=UPI00404AE111
MRRMWLGLTIFMVVFSAIGAAQVSIVSPRDGETVRTRWLTLKVEKSQEGHVMIWLDGKFITAITPPFEFRIDLAEQKIFSGTHTIRVAGFNRLGQKEGEAQVQFQVDLAGAEAESVKLEFKPRTGELAFYTFQATSETTVDVPARAIRQKVPQLSTKLVLRWFQALRDIAADRQYRMMRVVEDGVLEREVPIAMGGGFAMGAGPAGVMGPMGMAGEETGFGAFGPMGAPQVVGAPQMFGAPGLPMMPGAPSLATGTTRIRIRPIDNQKVSLFTLFPNGNILTGEEMPNVVKFAANSVDLTTPDRELKIGERWVGFITLPRNLENLTIIGAPMGGMAGIGGMPMMGGVPGEEFTGMPGVMGGPMMPGGPMMGGQMMPGRPMMPGGPMMGMPGRPGMPGAPMMPGQPTQPQLPGMIQEPEAFLADAPIVTIPVTHRFDGFEFWNDRLCARIISEFKGVAVEFDLMLTTGMGQMGMGPMGMYGGGSTMPGGPMMGGQMIPSVPGGMPGAPVGPSGQIQQPQTKLTGKADGTWTLLFDIENGQVVYVKVTVKATFDTDLLSISPFVQATQQVAGAPGAVGMPGAPTMPGGEGGFYGGMPFGGFGGAPYGGAFGFGGAPYGGAFGGIAGAAYSGGAPTTPSIFGRLGMGTLGPSGGITPGGIGAPGMPGWTPGMTGALPQPTFRNHPAKLLYSLNIENSLTHSGRLDQQLKALSGGK